MHLASPPTALQRARGRAEVSVSLRDGRTRLDRLFQQGCAKAFLPRVRSGPVEAVLVNTSGGVTGGDRLDYALVAGDGAALTVTTQAAERVYRSSGGAGRLDATLRLGAGARLEWLPQETILFEGGRLRRTLDVEMAADAELTALETLVLGRAAMGETLVSAEFSDLWRIRRAGRLVHAEALRLGPDIAAATRGAATLGGRRALATLVHVAPGIETRLESVRAMLAPPPEVAAAATARDGVLVLRFLAPGHAPLKTALVQFLTAFRAAPPPRVWSL